MFAGSARRRQRGKRLPRNCTPADSNPVVGVDSGGERHQVCLLDRQRSKIGERSGGSQLTVCASSCAVKRWISLLERVSASRNTSVSPPRPPGCLKNSEKKPRQLKTISSQRFHRMRVALNTQWSGSYAHSQVPVPCISARFRAVAQLLNANQQAPRPSPDETG